MEMLIRLCGLGWLSDAVNGYKVYIAGTAKFLLGLSGMIGGLASLVLSVEPGTGLIGLWKELHGPQFLAAKGAVLAGWYTMADGLADIGQRHALSKQAISPIVPQPALPIVGTQIAKP